MRVIAGKARRTNLKMIPGMEIRPTTDRIKETLFNILQTEIADARFLDLFSGSGGIGIEALSRGAQSAVFIDHLREAAQCIRENLKTTHMQEFAEVLQMDVLQGIAWLQGREAFSIIFMDPPYKEGLEEKTLRALLKTSLVDANTRLIVEASLERDFSFAEQLGYEIEREKRYKTNKHVFLRLADGKQGESQ